ncbi:MAG: glycerol-3-phosphate 1-O-acyltransferase PlsB [Pseudomonadales bacterium]
MMKSFERLWYALLARIASLWVRPDVLPEAPAELLQSGQQLCYVLETGSLADLLALHIICRKYELPLPYRRSAMHSWKEGPDDDKQWGSVVVIRRGRGFFLRRAHPQLPRMEDMLQRAELEQLVLLPTAIYWGRAPEKEHSLIKVLFSEQWDVAGRTRKFFTTLLHGRQTLARFSEPLTVASLLDDSVQLQSAAKEHDEPSPADTINYPRMARKLSRILRVHFRQRRIASLGPDQSHKRTIIAQVRRNPAVVKAIANEQNKPGYGKRKHWYSLPSKTADDTANDYAFEIAADMSYRTVRFMQRLLQWLWNRLYDGVQFKGLERLRAIDDGKELVYVPCHRSHIDYLLMSYALFMQGVSLPHIAAGLNLNMPLVGPFLRFGGAFYVRRSFAGNRLYAAVFNAYVQEIISRGHSMEYFIEGGRSRSGRLLSPKGGMLAMTIQAYLQDTERQIAFVPVYFGYERMVEGQSFISELGGAKKRKESFFGFIGSLQALRQQFGEVYANIGEPIELDDVLNAHNANWREQVPTEDSGDKPAWLNPVVDSLGSEIMYRINRAAAVTPVSILALALLSAPRQNLAKQDLSRQIDLLLTLLETVPYSDEVYLPEHDVEHIIAHGEGMGYIEVEPHALGELVLTVRDQAVALTYFRNNILHLFAVPATVAACFLNRDKLPKEEIVRLVTLAYPFLKTELFLHWSVDELETRVHDILSLFCSQGLILYESGEYSRNTGDDGAMVHLMLLAQSTMPALQRYYLTAVILGRQGSGQLKQSELETLCEQCAERLAVMHGLRSPDYFERKLFKNFVQTLKDQKFLRVDEDGLLHWLANIGAVEQEASLLLEEHIRHSVKSIAGGAQKTRESEDTPGTK